MVSFHFISGFMVGIEFFEDPIDNALGMILDLGIVRIIWER